MTHDDRPNDRQISLSRDRIAWIQRYLPHFDSVIDFGAGDCAAAFTFYKNSKVRAVHVVDPSVLTRRLAEKYSLGYSEDLAQAPAVDLIYSGHAIEHVHDLRLAMNDILQKIRPGGFF